VRASLMEIKAMKLLAGRRLRMRASVVSGTSFLLAQGQDHSLAPAQPGAVAVV